jgi:hypothetical protein
VLTRDSAPDLFARYGVKDTATYVFRPDGHVLARCEGNDAAFAAAAIAALLAGHSLAAQPDSPDRQLETDRLYDALAARVDEASEAERASVLESAVRELGKRVDRLRAHG